MCIRDRFGAVVHPTATKALVVKLKIELHPTEFPAAFTATTFQ